MIVEQKSEAVSPMSNVNIKRAVENIRANTTVYTPLVEIIVNGLHAIDETGRKDGKIIVRAHRSTQTELDDALPDIVGFSIQDNGTGFTDAHRDAFDMLYTDYKLAEGGKGFGRFICLKYFDNLRVTSVYRHENRFRSRCFSMGMAHEIIIDEKIAETDQTETGSTIILDALKVRSLDKKLSTIARNLVERLLPYFITQHYTCPTIIITDADETLCLNDYVNNELSALIREIQSKPFTLGAPGKEESFTVRVFKFYVPRQQKSKISLVAHKREVSDTVIHKYIPEFEDEFYERDDTVERNYIIKAYVFGAYLDRNVSLERGSFEFHAEPDAIHSIGQTQIEHCAAVIARDAMGAEITPRQQRKYDDVQSYIDQYAPWHKTLLSKIDLGSLPYNPSHEEIDLCLQREKFTQETAIRKNVKALMAETNPEKFKAAATEVVRTVSDTSKDELIHYIALRRAILDLFTRSLETDATGKYSLEGTVHDIIFPRKGHSDATPYQDHNLWLVDERLNFTDWISSDTPLHAECVGRPDLLVYDQRVLFRGDNEASNPVTIFEFKRPQRDDFVNPSSHEDPIQQLVRYVNNIRDGKHKTPKGRKINVTANTPFHGYVICDLSNKVERWLELEKNFKPMPDRQGWFLWMENINLYIEVLSWDKVLKDARMRNHIFFQKLGI
jgi:hypothetical protein